MVHTPYWGYSRTGCMAPNFMIHMVLKVDAVGPTYANRWGSYMFGAEKASTR